MATMLGLRWSSIILGVVWAVWHLPLFFIPGVDLAGQSFPIYVIDVTALSVAFTYLYANTKGSLLLPMLLHAAVNNTTGIVPAAAGGSSSIFGMHASMMGWLTGLLLWISAVYFLVRMPRSAAQFRLPQLG
jgi:membrane protease YdiL (CAAX protease family)